MRDQKELNILSLLFLISFAAAGAVLYAPALPQVAKRFGITAWPKVYSVI